MGLLQIGWYSVATFYAAKLVLGGFGLAKFDNTLFGPPPPGGENAFILVFVILAVVWGYLFAFLGGLGINTVARIATYFPIIPIVMLIAAAAASFSDLPSPLAPSTAFASAPSRILMAATLLFVAFSRS